MLLHITLYQRRFPLYKYVVVLLITAGVAVFTLYNQSSSGSSKKHKGSETSSLWGLFLLGVNLFLDGVTNSTQDYLFASARGLVSGPQMQCGLNVFGFLLTVGWLIVNPWSQELSESWAFVKENPGVANDVVGFALCGAIGQVFICKFSSSPTFSLLIVDFGHFSILLFPYILAPYPRCLLHYPTLSLYVHY